MNALPSFAEALRVWARIGCLSFGGPAAQIALLHREVVEERRWVGEARFLHALNFCTLLPGPEAMQLATYLGWVMHGVRGGVAAGLLFVVPGALVMLLLSLLYATLGGVPLAAGLVLGLQCAVLAIVVQALLRIAQRALHGALAWAVAAAAFGALFLFAVPFPAVIAAAALLGFLLPGRFTLPPHRAAKAGPPAALDEALLAEPGRIAAMAPGARRAGLVALALWLWPVALLMGAGGLWGDVAWFFSKLAVVTFGGAYAVLAYAAQEAVAQYGWLSAADMLAGLGLAETTPGPLILVLQFVGFMAGWREQGLAGGLLGSLLVLWVTFLPCFAWIFLGAPFLEAAQGKARLSGALAGVTAAVVGVIANLSLWFALRVLFGEVAGTWPDWATLRPGALGLALLAAALLFALRLGVPAVLGITALAGLALAVLA